MGIARAQVEEFVVADGIRFGEQPHIVGNLVFWQAYGKRESLDTIQSRDISRLDNPIIDVAAYPASSGGLLVSPEYVFRGAAYGPGAPSRVVARPVEALGGGTGRDISVSEFGHAVAATRDFVFLKVSWYEAEPYSRKFFAKARRDFGDGSRDSLKLIASFREQTLISRSEAASERYFVWQDRNPSVTEDTWKIYAKSTEDLFTAGTERLVLDSKVYVQWTYGVYLALYNNMLVVQAAEEHSRDSPIGIYLVNLDSAEDPIVPIAMPSSDKLSVTWPSISEHYVVWTDMKTFFERRAYAVHLADGKPDGEPFLISSGTAGGSWITIDRNIAVWNGATSFMEGPDVVTTHSAIIACELPLPGARDIGDVDQDGRLLITDAALILNYLFLGGWKPRLRLADVDGTGEVDISDPIKILEYLFLGGTLGNER